MIFLALRVREIRFPGSHSCEIREKKGGEREREREREKERERERERWAFDSSNPCVQIHAT